MTNDELWREFAQSGKVSDYLKYAFGQAGGEGEDCDIEGSKDS